MRNNSFIILLLFLLSASFASADNKKLPVDDFHRWSKLTSEELLKKGHYYYDKANIPDSAMLCYSIVANRYYDANKNDKTQMQQSASAMNQIGILYTHYYFDYQKAQSYLLMAQEIARFAVIVDLPSPEMALVTTTVWLSFPTRVYSRFIRSFA